MKRILIIEDDHAIAMALEDDLRLEGYIVETYHNGKEGLKSAISQQYDLMILDLMLPEMSGFEICRSIRSKGLKIPILMLTAKSQEVDKILGLEFGADDYVTKPFSPRVLMARVRALLRRAEINMRKNVSFAFGNVQVDFQKYTFHKNGIPGRLTALEFSLLRYFLENRGYVLSRDKILDKIWPSDVMVDPRTVDTHVANLRKKIEDDPKNPVWLIGIRGIGYKLNNQ